VLTLLVLLFSTLAAGDLVLLAKRYAKANTKYDRFIIVVVYLIILAHFIGPLIFLVALAGWRSTGMFI